MVVGAGLAGHVVADTLRAAGERVLVVEAGGRALGGTTPPEPDRRAWAYRAVGGAFDWYRVRAVGGRALLWGGWAHRAPAHVLARAGFPFTAREASVHFAAIERGMGVRIGDVDPRYRDAARALDVHVAPKHGAITRAGRPFVPRATGTRTHRVALRFEHERRRATALTVLDLAKGRAARLPARAFVLAPSPIETARILLDSELADVAGIGRGLVDHLVASYLLLEPRPAPPPDGRGPFPGMALVDGIVNVSAETRRDYRGGFTIELTGPVRPETLGVERMVRDPETWSATLVHALGETFAVDGRFVSLDPDRTDALGRRQPVVHVAFADEEARLAADMKRACIAFADALAVPGSRVVPFVDPLAQLGAGHEAGTCRAGGDDAPCDRFGRLRALANVWVADASALPTPTDRHPTLTALVHARRAAADVARRLARS